MERGQPFLREKGCCRCGSSDPEVPLKLDARIVWLRSITLPFQGLFGRATRHVASQEGSDWLELIGWHGAAFKLTARDAWIGGSPDQTFRR